MEKKQFVADLQAKDDVESVFLVKYINMLSGRDGRNYLNIILADSTGDMEARKWNDAEAMINNTKKGDYVLVRGKVNQFQNRLQLIVKDSEVVSDEDLNEDDFIVKAEGSAEEMFNDLVQLIGELDDVYIKELLLATLHDSEIMRRLKVWQAGKSIHHAYQSGLLEHILSCTQLAMSLSIHYKVNRNYVIAGAILHDLCKIFELTDGPLTEYTEEGKLVGHLVKSVELLDRFARKIEGFPNDLKLHLKHVLLSHHGHYEYGSPKVPQTSEAMLVHLIDLMDSKMNAFDTIKKNDTTPGRWSGFVKHLDRIIYKDELPHYTEKVEGTASPTKPSHKKSGGGKRSKTDSELKQNLSKQLEGLKID